MNHEISLACLILAALGMGLYMSYTDGPRLTRFLLFSTLFVAAITCGVIIGTLGCPS